ncbi:hypothetical protein GGR58DRAFT_483006 [Xylaria digitata]|nr:hypothetical protein GGR58DRAFT_483006 [Xylaria digitata]
MLKGVPDLIDLNETLRDYAKREHSYAEDSLPGITGLLSILSRLFEGGFLCGLPETCFDAALMWAAKGGCRRRVNSERNHSALVSPLPSWSWMGRRIDHLLMAPGEALSLDTGYYCITTPITRWFTHESLHSGLKRPIETTWFSFRERLETSSSSLPAGWVRKSTGEGPWPPFSADPTKPLLGKYYYHPPEFPNNKYGKFTRKITYKNEISGYRFPYLPHMKIEYHGARLKPCLYLVGLNGDGL